MRGLLRSFVALALAALLGVPLGGAAAGLGLLPTACPGCQEWTAAPIGSATSQHVAALALSPEGDTLFVTGDAPGPATTLALEAATGLPRWTAAHPPAHALAASPDGASLFVLGSELRALDAATGLPRWSVPASGVEVLTSPLGDFVVVRDRFHLEVRDAHDGALRSSSTWPWTVGAAAASDGEAVLLGFDWTGVVALDPRDGRLLWRNHDLPGAHLRLTPDGGLGFADYEDELMEGVQAFDPSTGAMLWWKPFFEIDELVLAPAGDVVVALGQVVCNRYGAAAYRADGSVAWSREHPWVGRGAQAVITGDGRWLVVFGEEATVALDMAAGEPAWTFSEGEIALSEVPGSWPRDVVLPLLDWIQEPWTAPVDALSSPDGRHLFLASRHAGPVGGVTAYDTGSS